jgi:hypothetical protein
MLEKQNVSIEGDLTARRNMKNDLRLVGEAALALAAEIARSTDILGIVVQRTQQQPLLLCQSRFFARS